jgi:hypothetical protein
MKNYIILLQGFKNIFLFDFMYAINVKNKPCFLVLDGMPKVSAIFHVGEDLGSQPMP